MTFVTPLVIAGCGPGAPEWVPTPTRAAVAEADVLAGAERLLALFPDAPGRRIPLQDGVGGLLDAVAAASGRVVLLVTGDPGVHSLAAVAVRRFGRDACRVIPAVSAVQLAFARVGQPWSDARILSAHASSAALPDPATLVETPRIALLAGNAAGADAVGRLADALASTHAAILCQALSLPEETVRPLAVGEVADAAGGPLALILLVRKEFLA
ncbi:MAG: precorrin-6y C5,15-methyltransferase (decarboxylating) subunit CbiE [Planctomycetota bacterium]